MLMKAMPVDGDSRQQDSYFERNSAWLRPVLMTAMFFGVIAVGKVLEFDLPLPAWVALVAGVVGAAAAGFGAMTTDTLSAYLIARGIVVFAVCAAVYYLVRPVAPYFVAFLT